MTGVDSDDGQDLSTETPEIAMPIESSTLATNTGASESQFCANEENSKLEDLEIRGDGVNDK
jgi:hypothetical protein